MSLLKRITTRAKQIYAKGGTWKGALKKAGSELKGSRSTTKRKRSTKRKHKKSVGVVFPSGVGSVGSNNGTIGSHLATAKKLIADRIGEKERQKFTTRLKSDKKRIQKEISALKKQYRKLK